MVKDVESTVAITVFFDETCSEEDIQAIGEEMRMRPEINTMDYISAQQAWENYSKKIFGDNVDIATAFGTDNPLAGSASYNITLKDIEKQQELVTYLQTVKGVRQVNSSQATANNLSTLNAVVGYVSMTVIIILLLVSVFLISNTITIGISIRKEEIGIMKLIGATDFFVRSPFMVEGVIIGLIGSAIPVILLRVMYNMVIEYLNSKFAILGGLITFASAQKVFATLIPVSLGIGVGIGFFGSLITTRKHLKV